MARPRKGESLGETGNVRVSRQIFERVQEIVGLSRNTAAQLISPVLQDWLAVEFAAAQKELARIAANPAMLPQVDEREDDAISTKGGSIRLPIWDSYRLNVIAAVRRQSTSLLLHQRLNDWVGPELIRVMRAKASELGIEGSHLAKAPAPAETKKPKRKAVRVG